ncbi:hypothetical protein BDK92_7327 [Micromonospora pisi]|uniref:Uncharacterized protein n=1 Tax=Micromonospora pisi TaxID=589240 RepID=A0A495JWB9_9ACTN|nr:hypothetical protein [Micromonospora pisi]RKR92845.1 hypothetical protein BDK92_7327 [Micromonospora pisi]
MSDLDRDDFTRVCVATYRYFNQGEIWLPKPPRERVRVADMGREWRFNAARFLERRAKALEFRYGFGEISAMSAPVWFDVVGEDNGRPVTAGPGMSDLDLMSDSASDAFDQAMDQRVADPVGWLRSTVLYRALVADLPTEQAEVVQLAERAKHWSTCPVRTGADDCRCEQIRAEHAATDTTPEWTLP